MKLPYPDVIAPKSVISKYNLVKEFYFITEGGQPNRKGCKAFSSPSCVITTILTGNQVVVIVTWHPYPQRYWFVMGTWRTLWPRQIYRAPVTIKYTRSLRPAGLEPPLFRTWVRCSTNRAIPAQDLCQRHAVFPGGHPPKYWPHPMMLDFGDQTRTGIFIMVWPLAVAETLILVYNFFFFLFRSEQRERWGGVLLQRLSDLSTRKSECNGDKKLRKTCFHSIFAHFLVRYSHAAPSFWKSC